MLTRFLGKKKSMQIWNALNKEEEGNRTRSAKSPDNPLRNANNSPDHSRGRTPTKTVAPAALSSDFAHKEKAGGSRFTKFVESL